VTKARKRFALLAAISNEVIQRFFPFKVPSGGQIRSMFSGILLRFAFQFLHNCVYVLQLNRVPFTSSARLTYGRLCELAVGIARLKAVHRLRQETPVGHFPKRDQAQNECPATRLRYQTGSKQPGEATRSVGAALDSDTHQRNQPLRKNSTRRNMSGSGVGEFVSASEL